MKRLLEVERIPPALIQAIVASQQQQRPTATTEVQREPQQPAEPPRQVPGLVGTWMTQRTTPKGMWVMLVQFAADGAFATESYINSMPIGGAQGTYRIVGQNIVGQNAQGVSFTYAFRLDGDVLVMNMPEAGGPVQFQRRPPSSALRVWPRQQE